MPTEGEELVDFKPAGSVDDPFAPLAVAAGLCRDCGTASLPKPQGIHLITAGPRVGDYLITVPADDGKVIAIGHANSIDKAAEVHDLVAIGLYGKEAETNFPASKYKMEHFIEILLSLQKLFPSNKFWVAFRNALEAGLKLHPGNPPKFPDMTCGPNAASWGRRMWPTTVPNVNQNTGKSSVLSIPAIPPFGKYPPPEIVQGASGRRHVSGNEQCLGENKHAELKANSEPAKLSGSPAESSPCRRLSEGNAARYHTASFAKRFMRCNNGDVGEEGGAGSVGQETVAAANPDRGNSQDRNVQHLGDVKNDDIENAHKIHGRIGAGEHRAVRGNKGTNVKLRTCENAVRCTEPMTIELSGDRVGSKEAETETDDEVMGTAEERKSLDTQISRSTIIDKTGPSSSQKETGRNALTGGYKGVVVVENRGNYAAIDWEGHPLHIGLYPSQLAAAHAYDLVSLGLFGVEADTNFAAGNYTQQEVQHAVLELKNRTGQIHRKDVANASRNAEAAGVPVSHDEHSSPGNEKSVIMMGNKTRTGRAIKRPMRYRDSPVQISDMEDSPMGSRDSERPRGKKIKRPTMLPVKTVASPHLASLACPKVNRPMPSLAQMGPSGMGYPPMFPMMGPMMGGMPMPFGFPGMRPTGHMGMSFAPPFMGGMKHPGQMPKRQ